MLLIYDLIHTFRNNLNTLLKEDEYNALVENGILKSDSTSSLSSDTNSATSTTLKMKVMNKNSKNPARNALVNAKYHTSKSGSSGSGTYGSKRRSVEILPTKMSDSLSSAGSSKALLHSFVALGSRSIPEIGTKENSDSDSSTDSFPFISNGGMAQSPVPPVHKKNRETQIQSKKKPETKFENKAPTTSRPSVVKQSRPGRKLVSKK